MLTERVHSEYQFKAIILTPNEQKMVFLEHKISGIA